MEMRDMTLTSFTAALASGDAVPGGGGASALTGALAAALGAMVGNLTIGRKKYADVEAEMIELTEHAAQLSRRLLALVDEDAKAFLPLSRAYGLPKDAPDRDDVLEACLRRAADAPLRILKLCCETVELCERFAEKGSRLAVSDAAAAAALAGGALRGAAVNVRVNTALMKRRDYADELDRETAALAAAYGDRADRIYAAVMAGYDRPGR